MPQRQAFEAVMHQRFGRRRLLQALASGGIMAALPAIPAGRLLAAETALASTALPFIPLPYMNSQSLHVAQGYRSQVLVAYGDAIGKGLTFGYNNDFLAYIPLEGGSDHGLLSVNHEYPSTELMFPQMATAAEQRAITAEQVQVEMDAVGHSVLEIKRHLAGEWHVVTESGYARRITASTPIRLSGPAAGHPRLQTSDDPTGKSVLGTFGNCAGGVSPWGTVLFAEENIDHFFMGQPEGREAVNHKRMGFGEEQRYFWGHYHPRFQLDKEPNEANRFGWMVEIDPKQPEAMPIKRTALGRFKHEAAGFALTKDGRVVVYMGDDEPNEYLYRFVSHQPYVPGQPTDHLLDEGVLSVARFASNGSLQWLPLVFGQGGLTPDKGFTSQADVLIEARRAGDVVGATPMDRPEDVQMNPVNGKVYVALTNNVKRVQTDAVNPRRLNIHGHILELDAGESGHGTDVYTWDILLLADGNNLSCPDNLAFDTAGNLWVATDGTTKTLNKCDGFYLVPVEGERRGQAARLVSSPLGSEVCGPEFTPDNRHLFLCIQHPGEGSSYDRPSTHWPTMNTAMPPKPAVVVIQRVDGKTIDGRSL